MSVRTVSAAAALTAAVAVYALVQHRRCRAARREAAAQRLMAGAAFRDNAALLRELEAFRRRLAPLLAEQAVLAAAGLVLAEALSTHDPVDPPTEGGPR
jgi:uncharacterized membrane protein